MATTAPLPQIHGEPLISLAQAAARYPGHRGASRLHPSTLTRWILGGVKGPHGHRIRLEAVRVGCRWLTSDAALARFSAALDPTAEPAAAVPVRTPSVLNGAARVAGDRLEELGA